MSSRWNLGVAGKCGLPSVAAHAAVVGLFLAAGMLSWGGCKRLAPGKDEASAPAAREDVGPVGLNVLLISVDTTRADHLGCYGHTFIRTPHIDRLAREGVTFLQCTSPAPLTLPTHCSMMTATYPPVHGARDNGLFLLHADNVTLAEAVKQAGYATAAEVAAFVLNREFGLNQGFDVYGDRYSVAQRAAGQERFLTYRKAEDVCDSALKWLRTDAGPPFFLFVHFFDPHQPYEPPERFAGQYAERYVAEIAYVDEQIGRLLAGLEETALDDRTLVILTSDHGEGRNQHGEETHATFIYDSTLSVPLIFRCRGLIPAGRRITAQVRLIDIAPTTLDLLGLAPLPDAQGVSLLPLIRGDVKDLRLAAYAESLYPMHSFGLSPLRALREGGWKYILAPEPELYHVRVDPGELRNLASAEPERARRMRRRLRSLVEESPEVGGTGDARIALTPESVEALQSLGYVGGGARGRSAARSSDELDLFEPRGPDPKDHVELIGLVATTVGLVRSDHPDAENALRECIAKAPDPDAGFAWAYMDLAGLLAKQQKYEQAIEWYRRALRVCPDDSRTLTALGDALAKIGRIDEAIAAHEAALVTRPVFAQTYCALGAALAVKGKTDQAIRHLRTALEIDPKLTYAYRTLGRVCAGAGRVGEAIKAYERAVELDEKHVPAYDALSVLLHEQGRPAEAIRLLRRGLKVDPEHPNLANNLAWLLATASDAGLRDGAEAVRLARLACRAGGDRNATFLDTLAAAYAEAGRFEDAVATAGHAVEAAGKACRDDVISQIASRRSLYEKRQAYRQP